jgi:hypothetical protein
MSGAPNGDDSLAGTHLMRALRLGRGARLRLARHFAAGDTRAAAEEVESAPWRHALRLVEGCVRPNRRIPARLACRAPAPQDARPARLQGPVRKLSRQMTSRASERRPLPPALADESGRARHQDFHPPDSVLSGRLDTSGLKDATIPAAPTLKAVVQSVVELHTGEYKKRLERIPNRTGGSRRDESPHQLNH